MMPPLNLILSPFWKGNSSSRTHLLKPSPSAFSIKSSDTSSDSSEPPRPTRRKRKASTMGINSPSEHRPELLPTIFEEDAQQRSTKKTKVSTSSHEQAGTNQMDRRSSARGLVGPVDFSEADPFVDSSDISNESHSKRRLTRRLENKHRSRDGLPRLPPPAISTESDSEYDSDDHSSIVSKDDRDILPAGFRDSQKRNDRFATAEEDEDRYESDFIDDDDEDADADDQLSTRNLELAITRSLNASKKTKDYVEDVIEGLTFVLLGVKPPRHMDVYKFALIRCNSEASFLADSEFSSSVWNADFIRALRAYPKLKLTRHTDFREIFKLKCDACERHRTVKFEVRFFGQPYQTECNAAIMTPIRPGPGGIHSDSMGILAPRTTKYQLGVTCKDNAVVAHQLRHWCRTLYGKIQAELYARHQLPASRPTVLDSSVDGINAAVDTYNDLFNVGYVLEWRNWFFRLLAAARKVKDKRYRNDLGHDKGAHVDSDTSSVAEESSDDDNF